MKDFNRFLIILIIKLLPLLILGAFVEYEIRSIPNSYTMKREYMDRNADKVELLFLGDSHIVSGLNPQDFSLCAYNLAQVAQLPELDYAVFKKYEKKLNNLKCLVLGIGVRTFFKSDQEPGLNNRYKFLIYYDIKTYPLDYSSYLELFNLRGRIGKLTKDFIKKLRGKKLDFIASDLNGYSPDYNQTYSLTNYFCTGLDDCKCPGMSRARSHNSKSGRKYVTENKKYINDIINICKKKNVKVILLVTPCYYLYRNHLEKSQLNEMREICEKYDEMNNNVYFLDLLDDDDFLEDDYRDVDHLRHNGAHKLSKKVNDFIEQHVVNPKISIGMENSNEDFGFNLNHDYFVKIN